jgi:hypothetical protein
MNNIVEGFKKLLDDENKDENDVQRYLEDNSELIPLPFLAGHQLHESAIISKLPIGNGYVSDFAYLTKCSDYWNLVLIEIEEPKKKTFLKDSEYIKFTAEFNNAYDQVLSWKAYLEEDNNTAELRKRVRKLMGDSPIANIPFYVKYVLIYGRKIEKQNSEKRIRMFNQKNTAEIHVMNFDSLISEYESKPPLPKMILSVWKENGFMIKKVPSKGIEMWLLAYLNSDYIKIDNKARENLIAQGYLIEKWEEGELLTEDGKMDKLSMYNSLSGGLKKALLEDKLKKAGKL